MPNYTPGTPRPLSAEAWRSNYRWEVGRTYPLRNGLKALLVLDTTGTEHDGEYPLKGIVQHSEKTPVKREHFNEGFEDDVVYLEDGANEATLISWSPQGLFTISSGPSEGFDLMRPYRYLWVVMYEQRSSLDSYEWIANALVFTDEASARRHAHYLKGVDDQRLHAVKKIEVASGENDLSAEQTV